VKALERRGFTGFATNKSFLPFVFDVPGRNRTRINGTGIHAQRAARRLQGIWAAIAVAYAHVALLYAADYCEIIANQNCVGEYFNKV
jgi:hypothetical protein